MATATEVLLTAEEFEKLPDDGIPKELVRGRLIPMSMATPRHGEICSNGVHLFRNFLDKVKLGRIVCNDSAVQTEHDPDTVRGADWAFYSYKLYPKGPLPKGYLRKPPELAFEVRSSGDSWRKILVKVAEYLDAGVQYVCVLDQKRETATIYSREDPEVTLTRDQKLTFPSVLPGFSVLVAKFFE